MRFDLEKKSLPTMCKALGLTQEMLSPKQGIGNHGNRGIPFIQGQSDHSNRRRLMQSYRGESL